MARGRGEDSQRLEILSLEGIPEIGFGDDLAKLIAEAAEKRRMRIREGDLVVVTQKIVSKSERRMVRLDSIKPSRRASRWAAKYGKDARVIELVLREAKRIVRMKKGVIVAKTRHGFICANAGVDTSNTPPNTAALLPKNPDESARRLKERLTKIFGVRVAVIISDTFGRPWREGLANVALGVAGIGALADYRGERDASGKRLQATVMATADELASAAEIVMGKSKRVPVAVIRGAPGLGGGGTGRELIRPAKQDLFR